MKPQQVIVEVFHSGKNFSAHMVDLPGCVATGSTFRELKRNLNEAIELHLEGMREDLEQIPSQFENNWVLEFRFSAEALLNAYNSIFTKAALSRITGINERQLWHYAAGVRKPRPEQVKRIEKGIHELGQELLTLSM
jgi:predicted RNase H-like HicB family nuclease